MKKASLASFLLAALILFAAVPLQAQVNAEISVGTPPPAIVEQPIPAAPGPPELWVWHKAHYRWIDGQYVLVPGHWVQRPRPGAVWVEPRWVERGGGWVFVQGHWR